MKIYFLSVLIIINNDVLIIDLMYVEKYWRWEGKEKSIEEYGSVCFG